MTNDVYSALDSGDLIGAIFIDLKKAFDLVDHYLLLDKLYAVGFSKNSLLWFNSYLHNRKQCVVVQGKLSDLFIHERGVPQGSILGPLLFSIFINDLPLILSHCSVHLNADDTVIYVSNPHLIQIQNMLQSDFNALQEWLYSNNLLLNKGKSQTMIFGTVTNPGHELLFINHQRSLTHHIDFHTTQTVTDHSRTAFPIIHCTNTAVRTNHAHT